MLKKILAIHDIACVGRCSLTVILPILSAMGVQACPLPTALMSSHPGGFTGVVVNDLTENLEKFPKQWDENGINFDCVYTGFFSSKKQIDICSKIILEHKKNNVFVYIDPVMGDNGNRYSMMDTSFVEKMKSLVCSADLITPNYTEACFLLDKEYSAGDVDKDEIMRWLVELSEMGPDKVVITGVCYEGAILNVAFDKNTGIFYSCKNKKINAKYPGTGDVFGSVLIGNLILENSFGIALKNASDFVFNALESSVIHGGPVREGVNFEDVILTLK